MKATHIFAGLAATLLLAAASIADAGPGRGGGYRSGGHGGGSAARHSGGHRGGSWQGHGHRHWRGSHYRSYWGAGTVFIGATYYGWPGYAYPYYPAPGAYVAPPAYYPQATEYVEQAPVAQGFWYFCAESRAYYPQVQDCPGGWQRVAPRPPQ